MSGVLNKLLADGTVQFVAGLGDVPFSSVNILVSNPTGVSGSLQVWIGTGITPAMADRVEPGAIVAAKGRYEDLGRICSGGEKLFVQAPAGWVIRAEAVDES